MIQEILNDRISSPTKRSSSSFAYSESIVSTEADSFYLIICSARRRILYPLGKPFIYATIVSALIAGAFS
jgi:hypothetical protein